MMRRMMPPPRRKTVDEANADVVIMTTTGSLAGRRDLMRQSYPFRAGCDDSVNSRCYCHASGAPTAFGSPFSAVKSDRQRVDLRCPPDRRPTRACFLQPGFRRCGSIRFTASNSSTITLILRETKEPVLLAGDFSAPVIVADMRWFLGNNRLSSVYPEPATWPAWLGPLGVSNDHVFFKAPLSVLSVNRTDSDWSVGVCFSLISNIAIK